MNTAGVVDLDAGTRPRVLLIAPMTSYRTAAFCDAARNSGVDLVIASDAVGLPVPAGAEGLSLDMRDRRDALGRILGFAARRPIHAIVATDDATVELAAEASAALGLPHNAPNAARLTRRKDLARDCLARAGVPVPRHRRIDLQRPLATQVDGIAFPCVVKPVALSGSRGVIRSDDRATLLRACARVADIVRGVVAADERRYLLVEDYVPGIEVAVEGLLRRGRLDVLAIFDKPDPLVGPYFAETYYVTPSRLAASVQTAVQSTVQAACAAYGMREGPIHAECRINADGVWLLEVAARSIGGHCGRLLRTATGIGLDALVLAHALGRPVTAERESGGAGVLMIPVHESGILRRVEGQLAAARVPYVEEVSIDIAEGQELVPLPEGSRYLGFIFARAPGAAEAEAALRTAHACLKVIAAPLWRAVPA